MTGRRRAAAMVAAVLAVPLIAACAGATPTTASASDVFVSGPWRAGERHEYRLRNAAGDELGRGLLTTRLEGDRLVLEQVYTEAQPAAGLPPIRDVVTLHVDAKTLRPQEGTRETDRRDATGKAVVSTTSWTYRQGEGREVLRTKVSRPGAGVVEGDLVVRAHSYDNESSLWLWRGIAFAEGYDAAYISVNPIERTQMTVSLRVPQREQVEVPAGTFDTWRILLRTGRAARTAWINSQAPHQVVRWDNGDIIFELTKSEN